MSRPALGIHPVLPIILVVAAIAWGYRMTNPEFVIDRRGLPAEMRPVHVVRLDGERHEHALHKAGAPHLAGSGCARTGLRMLGLGGEPRFDPEPSLMERIEGERMLPSFYRPGSDTLFIQQGGKGNLRHEYIHALHDQYSDLVAMLAGAETLDARVAVRAVVEGVAVHYTRGASLPLPSGATFEHNELVVAYGAGPRYVARHSVDVLSAFQLHPVTAYEVLFHDAPRLADLPPPALAQGEGIECTDRLGVTGMLAALAASSLPPGSEGDLVLAAWRGDRMDVIRDVDGERRVVWTVALGSARASELWSAGPALHIPLTRPATRMPVLVVPAEA
jgi:hypothetical protein